MGICTIAGCTKPLKKSSLTMCSMHWERKRRHGDPNVLLVQPRGVCSIDGCERPHSARGLCAMHVSRLRKRGGDPAIWHPRTPLAERLMSRVDLQPSGCWNYTGTLNAKGYGLIGSGGRGGASLRAHRVSYEIHVGPIPEGLEIDHLCFNPSCVNPLHLEPVTRDENLRRRRAIHGSTP